MEEDDFRMYGLPLEIHENEEARPRKAARVEDQIAVDKQGRRRFHGAFSGGFSAGYFNSVGTKEGWTPSTFVSSRNQKKEQFKPPTQTVQDFMDDEDMGDFGFAPSQIRINKEYDSETPDRFKRKFNAPDTIPGPPVLQCLFDSNKDTIGETLLRKFGWKPGQGVGPRISKKKKYKKKNLKIYGFEVPKSFTSDKPSDSEDDEINPDIDFAPLDINVDYIQSQKDNQFGLGYKPLDRTSVLGRHINLFEDNYLSMVDKKKKLHIKGQAFGVGAFEEEDDDIYAQEDITKFDFSLTEEKARNKPITKRNESLSFVGLTKALAGFKLDNENKYVMKCFQPPNIPSNYIPKHIPRKKRLLDIMNRDVKEIGRHDISAKDRSRILDPNPTKQIPPKILDNRNTSGSDKLIDKSRTGSADDSSKASAEKGSDNLEDLYKEFCLNENDGKSDVKSFKPFKKYPDKQRRYELYLRMKDKGMKDRYHLAQPKQMREWEKDREIQEFERASQLFKPLASSMSSRFVTATLDEESSQKSTSDFLSATKSKTTDDKVNAAKMKLYGHLTQTTIDWCPDRLVCRRFNVEPPSFASNKSSSTKSSHRSTIKGIFTKSPSPEVLEEPDNSFNLNSTTKESSSEIPQVDDEKQEEELLNINLPEIRGLKVPYDGKPTKDLFKAIFCDSDNTDNEEEPTNQNSVSMFISSIRYQNSSSNDVNEGLGGNSNHYSHGPTKTNVKPINKTSEHNSEEESSPSLNLNRNNDNKNNSSNSNFHEKTLPSKRRTSRFDIVDPEKNKPVFVSKKERQNAVQIEKEKTDSIFAHIDYDALNKYKEFQQKKTDTEKDEVEGHIHVDKEKSPEVDDNEYGPSLPTSMSHQPQKNIDKTNISSKYISKKSQDSSDCEWVEKSDKISKKHKLKKHKKLKKKSKKKEKKKKSKKKSRHRYSSSSSSSDSD